MAKVTRYAVTWHVKDNKNATQSMGIGELYLSESDARSQLEEKIEHDYSAMSGDTTAHRGHKIPGTGIWFTEVPGKVTYYQVIPVELDDIAADACEHVKALLADKNRNFADKGNEALKYLLEEEAAWKPLREWEVDIMFSPAACVHHVMARTATEAERQVNEMIEGRKLALSEVQKAEMMDSLLENVESVKAVCPEGGANA